MAKRELHRIIRRSTPAEKRRHWKIREKTDDEFSQRRKSVSASRVILAKLRSQRELKGVDERRPAAVETTYKSHDIVPRRFRLDAISGHENRPPISSDNRGEPADFPADVLRRAKGKVRGPKGWRPARGARRTARKWSRNPCTRAGRGDVEAQLDDVRHDGLDLAATVEKEPTRGNRVRTASSTRASGLDEAPPQAGASCMPRCIPTSS